MAGSMSERTEFLSRYLIDGVEEGGSPSPAARRIQVVSELVFLGVAFYAGLTARSPWVILALGLISLIAYAVQHGRLWREAAKAGSKLIVLRGVIGSLLLQTALIAAVYFAGLGIWTAVNHSGVVLAFGMTEMIALGALLALAIVSGAVVGWLERRSAARSESGKNGEAV